MPVPFRFETVLRVRQSERDQCRQILFRQQRREAALLSERAQFSAERNAALEELRMMQQNDNWVAERVLARQQHAELLATSIARLDNELNESFALMAQYFNDLLEADKSVKALEKLQSRHTADQRQTEQWVAERDRDDAWRAA